jgi:hypothetical protein
VRELVDLFRLQGIPAERGVTRIRTVAMRATVMMSDADPAADDASAGEAPAERIAMIVQWAAQRYRRND